ncbi:MAG: type II secretion system protein [Planctomycetes bacterium]|nr:type II secretion system protein [Planctomycetota bacterium]
MARGFTIIEMLAVVTILAIATGVLAMGVGTRSADARLRETSAGWRDLDARARLFARSVRSGDQSDARQVALTVSSDASEVTLVDLVTGDRLSRFGLPDGLLARIDVEPRGVVRYDRLGRCADYTVELTGEARSMRFTIDGMTGRVTEEAL